MLNERRETKMVYNRAYVRHRQKSKDGGMELVKLRVVSIIMML
jgi:hypothetical protein